MRVLIGLDNSTWSVLRVFLDRIVYWWMATSNQVSGPKSKRSFSVELKRLDGRPALWGHTNDAQAITGPNEMLVPGLSSWVEEKNRLAGCRIYGDLSIGFFAIAMKTSECQVIQVIGAAAIQWDNVINSKGDILPLFCCVAVFAQMMCSSPHLALRSSGYFSSQSHD